MSMIVDMIEFCNDCIYLTLPRKEHTKEFRKVKSVFIFYKYVFQT